MWQVIRSILAVIAGFVAASAVMIVVEMINGHVLYPELGKLAAGMTDREEIRSLLMTAPFGAFLVVLLGWVLGSLAGGFLTAWISRTAPAAHALVLGLLLTLAGIANNMMMPPPAWFWAVTLVAFIPAAYAGAMLRATKQLPAS